MTRVIVNEESNNTELRLHIGDELVIRLEAIPGTGYAWIVSGGAGKILSQTGEPVFERTGEKILGGVERQILSFRVESAGSQSLELEYRRSWEKPGMAKKKFFIRAIAEK
jgi:predicted secreted protein